MANKRAFLATISTKNSRRKLDVSKFYLIFLERPITNNQVFIIVELMHPLHTAVRATPTAMGTQYLSIYTAHCKCEQQENEETIFVKKKNGTGSLLGIACTHCNFYVASNFHQHTSVFEREFHINQPPSLPPSPPFSPIIFASMLDRRSPQVYFIRLIGDFYRSIDFCKDDNA